MVKISDSTRRFITFFAIVIVGSVLLIFDIPILYLLFAMLFIALVFALFTGMLILSEVTAGLREQFKEYRAKIKAQTAKERSEKKKEQEKKKEDEEKATKKTGGGLFGRFLSKGDKKKEKPSKDDKDSVESPSEDSTPVASTVKAKSADTGDLNLDDFDLDLDLDAELDDLETEIGDVRTPYAADNPMADLSRNVSNLDIATDDEEEDIIIDSSLGDDDDINSIYASTMDIGENDGEDMLANMEGGISAGDLAAYNSSDDSPYNYGGDDDGSDEEQYEAGGSLGGGMDDDDLLASLKSDIDNLKKRDDNVLLRDLKNLKFTAQELVDELSEIVEIITKPKKR